MVKGKNYSPGGGKLYRPDGSTMDVSGALDDIKKGLIGLEEILGGEFNVRLNLLGTEITLEAVRALLAGALMVNYDSGALAASGVIKAASGTLYGIMGYNSRITDQYFQVFNLAAVPANGIAPNLIPPILIPAGSVFSIDLGFHGKVFGTGICWSNSSTLVTKTIGTADVWLTATYK